VFLTSSKIMTTSQYDRSRRSDRDLSLVILSSEMSCINLYLLLQENFPEMFAVGQLPFSSMKRTSVGGSDSKGR